MDHVEENLSIQPIPAQAAPRLRLPPTLRSFQHYNYRLYFLGQIISLTGTWMQNVAQSWLVYRLTGSPLALGAVSFAQSLPILMFALTGGVMADRVDKKRLLMVTQTSSLILASILAMLAWSGAVQVWHVIALAFLLGCVDSFDTPTRQAMVVDMVGKEDLMNAISLNSATFNMARLIGPSIAGLLIASVGEAGAFAFNALSFIPLIIMLPKMRIPPASAAARSSGSVWRNLKEGLAFIMHEKVVRTLVLMVAVPAVFGMPYSTLMPVFTRDVLGGGAAEQGLMLSAVGLGSLIGALSLASLSGFKHKGWLVTAGTVVFSAALILFSFSKMFWLSLAILPFVGWSMITQMSTTQTLLQTTVPDHLRGRVMSVHFLMFRGMMPLAGLYGGVTATFFSGLYGVANGAPLAVTLGAAVCGAVALFVILRAPYVRRLE